MSEPEVSTVSCPCGASIEVDLRSGRPVKICPDCKQSITVVVTLDPKTQKKRIGILVSPEAVAPRRVRRKPATKVPVKEPALTGSHNPKCACGARVAVDLRSMDSVYTCGFCGACYTAVGHTDPSGSVVALLMPVEVLPLKKEKKTTVRRMAKPRTEAGEPAGDLKAKENLLLLTRTQIGAQPLVDREKGSLMACFCGHEIAVSAEAAHRILKCQECGLSFRIFMAVEPRTGKAMVVTLPRGPIPGKDKP